MTLTNGYYETSANADITIEVLDGTTVLQTKTFTASTIANATFSFTYVPNKTYTVKISESSTRNYQLWICIQKEGAASGTYEIYTSNDVSQNTGYCSWPGFTPTYNCTYTWYAREYYTVTINKGTGISSATGSYTTWVNGSGTITANGSALVPHDSDSGTGDYQGKLTLSATASSGYTFSGWTGFTTNANASFTLATVTSDITLTANATAGAVNYKVYHYLENLGVSATLTTSNCTLQETETLSGTTGGSVTPAVKSYTGFTAPSTQTVTINGAGTTAVYYYYTRNSYYLDNNMILNGGTFGTGITGVTFKISPAHGTTTTAGDYYSLIEYGDTVTISNMVNDSNRYNYIGYSFSGGYTGSSTSTTWSTITFTMGAGTTEFNPKFTGKTYTISWASGTGSPTSYTVSDAQTKTLSATRTGYTVSGYSVAWSNTTNSGSTLSISGSTLTIPAFAYGNITVTPSWYSNGYNVTLNDGLIGMQGVLSGSAGVTTSYDYSTNIITINGTTTGSTGVLGYFPLTSLFTGQKIYIKTTLVSGTATFSSGCLVFDIYNSSNNAPATRCYKDMTNNQTATLTVNADAVATGTRLAFWIYNTNQKFVNAQYRIEVYCDRPTSSGSYNVVYGQAYGNTNIYPSGSTSSFSSIGSGITLSNNIFTVNYTNSTTSTQYQNFFTAKDTALRSLVSGKTYTYVLEVLTWTGGTVTFLFGDSNTAGQAQLTGKNQSISGTGTYYFYLTAQTGSSFLSRDFIAINAGVKAAGTFRVSLYEGSVKFSTFTYSAPNASLPTPTKTGYTFNGWYTAVTGGTKVEATTTVTTASAHTLYAQWTRQTYTLDLNGAFNNTSAVGGISPNKVTIYVDGVSKGSVSDYYSAVPYGARVTLSSFVAGSGYTYAGYAFYVGLSTSSTSTTWSDIAFTMPTSEVRLYIRTNGITYTITTDPVGGSAVSNYSYTTDDETQTITLPKPTKSHYTFAGWTSNSSSCPVGADGVTVSIPAHTYGEFTVTAQWTPVTYTLSYNCGYYEVANDVNVTLELLNSSGTVVKTATVNRSTQSGSFTFTYDSSEPTYTLRISEASSRSYMVWIYYKNASASSWVHQSNAYNSYSYTGWKVNENATWTWYIREYFAVTVNKSTGVSSATFTSKNWVGSAVNLTANATSYEVAYGASYTFSATASSGYTFAGWHNNYWGKNKFSLGIAPFVENYGSSIAAITGTNSVTVTSTNPGAWASTRYNITTLLESGVTYYFSYTESDSAGGVEIEGFDRSTGARTLCINWGAFTPNTTTHFYYIRVFTNYTEAAKSGTFTYTYSNIQIEKGSSKTDFEAYNGTRTATSFTGTVTADLSLTANTIPNAYTVVFNKNTVDNAGLALKSTVSGSMANQAYTYGVAQALRANAFTCTGYTFKGWSTSSTATSATYSNSQSVSNLATSGTLNLYAIWERNTYTFTFNYNIPSALRGNSGHPTVTVTGKYGDSLEQGTLTQNTANLPMVTTITGLLNGINLYGYKFSWWTTTAPTSSNNYLIYELDDFEPTYATLSNNVTPTLGTFNGDKIFYAEWYKLLPEYDMASTSNSFDDYNPNAYYVSINNYYVVQNKYDLIWMSAMYGNNSLQNKSFIICNDISLDDNFTYYSGTTGTTYTLSSTPTTYNFSTMSGNQFDFQGASIWVGDYSGIDGRTYSAGYYAESGYTYTISFTQGYANFTNGALFGSINNARVCSITVNLNNIALNSGNYTYVGGVIGYAYYSLINYVQVQNLDLTVNASYAGGIVGYLGQDDSDGGAYSSFSTSSSKTIKISGSATGMGGLVGYMGASDDIGMYIYMTYLSDITVTNSKSGSYTGGLVGSMSGSYDMSCYITSVSEINVYTTATSGSSRCGGLIGYGYYAKVQLSGASYITVDSKSTAVSTLNATGGVFGVMGPYCSVGGSSYTNSLNMFDINEYADELYGVSDRATKNSSTGVITGIHTYSAAGTATTSYDPNTKTISMYCPANNDCYISTYANIGAYMVEVKPSTTYTFSWTQNDTSTSFGAYSRPVIFTWSGTNTSGASMSGNISALEGKTQRSGGRYSYTFTTPSNCYYLSFRFGMNGQTTSGTITFKDIRLTPGSASSNTYSVHTETFQMSNINVSGGSKVGGVVGYMGSYTKVYNLNINGGIVTGIHDVGGIAGYCVSTYGAYSSTAEIVRNRYGTSSHSASIYYCKVNAMTINGTGYLDENDSDGDGITEDKYATSNEMMYNRTGTDPSGNTVRLFLYDNYPGSYVGGIVGYMYKGTLISCETKGNTIYGYWGCVAGIMGGGMNVDAITYCLSDNKSITTSTEASFAASSGIVGAYGLWKATTSLSGTPGVSRSTNYTPVTSTNGYMVAGIIGLAIGSYTGATSGNISTYSWLSSQNANHGKLTGYSQVAGIIGYMNFSYAGVHDNINTGIIAGTGSTTAGLVGNVLQPCQIGYNMQAGNMTQTDTSRSYHSYIARGVDSSSNEVLVSNYYYESCCTLALTVQTGEIAADFNNLCNVLSRGGSALSATLFRQWGIASSATRGWYAPQVLTANGDRCQQLSKANALNNPSGVTHNSSTGDNIFVIDSLATFNKLRTLIANGDTTVDGQSYATQEYWVTTSIRSISEPLGTSTTPFSGTIKGATTSGTETTRTMTLSISNQNYSSLLGYISGANVSYITTAGTVSSGGHVAGIAGYAENSTITSCTNTATVTGTGNYIGGIVGEAYSWTYITSCTNSGAINGGSQVGGIAGQIIGYAFATSCTNSGAVTGGCDIGGVVGRITNSSVAKSCTNSATITGELSVGGLAGSIQGSASVEGTSSAYCSNSGTVNGYYYTGGIGGYVVPGIDVYAIRYANNTGEVRSRGYSDGMPNFGRDISWGGVTTNDTTYVYSANKVAAIGGIAGYLQDSHVKNVGNSGSVVVTYTNLAGINVTTGVNKVYINSGAILGFGGIVGYAKGASTIGNTTINANLTIGIAGTTDDWSSKGLVFLGGFVGLMIDGPILAGSLTNSVADSAISSHNSCPYTVYLWGSFFTAGIVAYTNMGNGLIVAIKDPSTGTVYVANSVLYSIVAYVAGVAGGLGNSVGGTKGTATKCQIGAMTLAPKYKVNIGGSVSSG